MPIIPIPEEDWQTVRSDFLSQQEETEQKNEPTNDPVIEKARELVGDEILEIRD